MDDYVIRTGDLITVTIASPTVVPALAEPVPLRGSSTNVVVCGAAACLEGDELPTALALPLPYTAPPFTNPGTGKLSLTLQPSNLTTLTKNGKALLIKGQQFTATFTVETPATQSTPAGPVSDPVAVKSGTARFTTTNNTVRIG